MSGRYGPYKVSPCPLLKCPLYMQSILAFSLIGRLPRILHHIHAYLLVVTGNPLRLIAKVFAELGVAVKALEEDLSVLLLSYRGDSSLNIGQYLHPSSASSSGDKAVSSSYFSQG